jgi:hypothetical protein
LHKYLNVYVDHYGFWNRIKLGSIVKSAELGSHADEMSAAKNIVILGGSKSSNDAGDLNASQGRHVGWLIRGKPGIEDIYLPFRARKADLAPKPPVRGQRGFQDHTSSVA